MSQGRARFYLALILGLALVIRLGAVLYLGDFRTPWVEDWENIARTLVTRGYFGLDSISLYGPNPKGVTAFIPPVYPGFLALTIIFFGTSAWNAVRIIQAILSVVSVGLIYWLGRSSFRRTDVALLAALAAAVFPPLIGGVVEINAGIFEVLSYELVVVLSLYALRQPTWWRWVIVGLALGFAALVKSTILALLPFLLFYLWVNRARPFFRTVVQPFAIVVVFAAVVISPWTVRNYRVLGEFIPISSNGGVNFWIGNHPGASGEFIYPPPELLKETDQLTEGARDRFFYQRAWSFIQQDPQQFARLLGLKTFYFFWERPSAGENYSNQTATRVGRFVYLLANGLLLPLCAVGIILAAKEWRQLVLLYGAMVSVLIVNVVYFAGTRYRAPVYPFEILPACYGMVLILRHIQVQRVLPLHSSSAE